MYFSMSRNCKNLKNDVSLRWNGRGPEGVGGDFQKSFLIHLNLNSCFFNLLAIKFLIFVKMCNTHHPRDLKAWPTGFSSQILIPSTSSLSSSSSLCLIPYSPHRRPAIFIRGSSYPHVRSVMQWIFYAFVILGFPVIK